MYVAEKSSPPPPRARLLPLRSFRYVVNVTLPDSEENYVHRIGRVGRAERMGLAISLVRCVPRVRLADES